VNFFCSLRSRGKIVYFGKLKATSAYYESIGCFSAPYMAHRHVTPRVGPGCAVTEGPWPHGELNDHTETALYHSRSHRVVFIFPDHNLRICRPHCRVRDLSCDLRIRVQVNKPTTNDTLKYDYFWKYRLSTWRSGDIEFLMEMYFFKFALWEASWPVLWSQNQSKAPHSLHGPLTVANHTEPTSTVNKKGLS